MGVYHFMRLLHNSAGHTLLKAIHTAPSDTHTKGNKHVIRALSDRCVTLSYLLSGLGISE